MKFRPMVLATILITSNCLAKTIVVAVIDTGIDLSLKGKNIMCDKGHKDFSYREKILVNGMLVEQPPSIKDTHGHGTHISGLIDQYVKGIVFDSDSTFDFKLKRLQNTKVDYCQVILKYWNPSAPPQKNVESIIEAIKYATELKVDYINISGGGPEFIKAEHDAVKAALKANIKLVVAAGNDGKELGKQYFNENTQQSYIFTYYPAMYTSDVIVVGNGTSSKLRAPSSNYGNSVSSWEEGTSALSIVPYWNSVRLYPMTGTSQSTAIKTGKLIRKQLNN